MKRTVRSNIHAAYSLHDMSVIGFDIQGDDIVMRTQSGLVRIAPIAAQADGYVEFYGVQWDFSYAYLLGIAGNEGRFSGEKMFLRDFLDRYAVLDFCVMDETYGYNSTKYSGYLSVNRQHYECIIEICHEGDMVFVEL